MKKILLTPITLFIFIAGMSAQMDRYIDEVFSEVTILTDQTYGANVDVLQQGLIELKTDIYSPTGDTETNRPVVLLSHTGSFIPRIFNQAATGFKDDSVVVEVATRLAKRGYVVFAYTYRQGWLPQSTDDNVRKGTLLQAAYRAIQDTRTLARYIRRTVDQNANPFGVDGTKIAAWGIGTGGYLSFGAATLDDPEEVELDKFINTATLEPFADTLVLGNFDGTSFGTLNGDTVAIPNHVGYNSDIQMAVNMGGALGDASWIDGDASSNEPPMVGFHAPTDIFAPYYIGPVIVPGPNFVVLDEASGTREAIELANDFGLNDVLEGIPASDDPLKPIIDFYKTVDVSIAGENIKLGTDNFYPTVGLTPGAGSPWDWWDLNVLRARVAGINNIFGTDFNADTIHQSGLLTNPDMSGEKAKRYVDTVFMVAAPRLCQGLGLDCGFSGVNTITAQDVSLKIGPNPATDVVNFSSDIENPITRIVIFDATGRAVKQIDDLRVNDYQLQLNEFSAGNYYVGISFDRGLVVEQLTILRN